MELWRKVNEREVSVLIFFSSVSAGGRHGLGPEGVLLPFKLNRGPEIQKTLSTLDVPTALLGWL